jgi:hypothetical protein
MALSLTANNGLIDAVSLASFDRQLINLPEAPGDTVEFRGWTAFACTLTAVEVYCATVNTVGTYTLTVTNGSNTVLNAANFNMNTLTANTVTALTLTSTSLASNDAGMDAAGVYISLNFTSS